MSEQYESGNRRDFIKKAAYVVPAVMSVNVALATARAGSHDHKMGAKGAEVRQGARNGARPERQRREK